ncbi:hypothetical protein V9T40_001931 [Parthenolecanium corni]|uniref:Uncharacterized protein n=1 Tax=Parthenolecanium corni TaxID=536013 RepID=A0AAN9TJW2_9HEMI
MNKGNSSGSQSSKSGGAGKPSKSGGSSQPRGGNHGGASTSGNSEPEETGEQIVRRLAWDMAGCANSYSERLYLAERFYDKFMDGDM